MSSSAAGSESDDKLKANELFVQIIGDIDREYAVRMSQAIDNLVNSFDKFKGDKTELEHEHWKDEFKWKIWNSFMLNSQVKFRSNLVQNVDKMRQEGYTGPEPEFPEIDMEALMEHVRKNCMEENQELAQKMEQLSMLSSVQKDMTEEINPMDHDGDHPPENE